MKGKDNDLSVTKPETTAKVTGNIKVNYLIVFVLNTLLLLKRHCCVIVYV